MPSKNYLEYILNPFDLLRTKKVLKVILRWFPKGLLQQHPR